jgi:hypothetical protein
LKPTEPSAFPGVKPPDTPLVKPLDPDPAAGVKLPEPIPTPAATRIEGTKPAGETAVQPVAASTREPRTNYDEDVYEVKQGDSFTSISLSFYNDEKYAAALQQYNGNAPQSGQVKIPPIHVLKKQFPNMVGGSSATPKTGRTAPPSPEWSAPPSTARSGNVYRVPAGGATIRGIAKAALGSDQEWRKVWDLNPQHWDPNATLPPGTEVKLPSDARNPQ